MKVMYPLLEFEIKKRGLKQRLYTRSWVLAPVAYITNDMELYLSRGRRSIKFKRSFFQICRKMTCFLSAERRRTAPAKSPWKGGRKWQALLSLLSLLS